MKNKWFKWSFWPILLIVAVLGYFYTKSTEKNLHLNYIPSSAKVVMMIDSKTIAQDYYELLRYDPTAIDKVLEGEEQQESPIEGFELPGTVPFEKLAIYVYQDKEADDQFFKCMIATISDRVQYIKANNPQGESPEREERDGGEILHLKADNKLILIKNGIGVVIEPVLPAFEMDATIGERHFDEVFTSGNSLMENEKSFADVVEEHDHLGIWSGEENNNHEDDVVGHLMPLGKIFTSQNVSINLMPSVIDVKSHLYVQNKDFFIEDGNEEIHLNDDEFVKMSMSLNPDYFEDMFTGIIPDANKELLDVWTGKLALSVIGFRKKPIDYCAYDSVACKMDTSEIDSYVNLPDVACTAEITSSEGLIAFFESDTIFKKTSNGYKYQIPNLVNEFVYIYPSEKGITIASKELQTIPEPVYTTFAFSVNIQKLFTEYPPKDMIQTILLPSLNKFAFKKFEMHYDGMTDDYLIVHGGLKMGEEDQNTLLQIIPVIYNLMINF